jgi:hypothetical protein
MNVKDNKVTGITETHSDNKKASFLITNQLVSLSLVLQLLIDGVLI